MSTCILAAFLLFLSTVRVAVVHGCPAAQEDESLLLTKAINDERESRGLPRLTVSNTLIDVAQKHVLNLEPYSPITDLPCGMHSWEANLPGDDWSHDACCYSEIICAQPTKPRKSPRIGAAGGCDPVNFRGYEISYWTSQAGGWGGAIAGWLGSPGHKAVMLTEGSWANLKMVGM